MDGTADRRPANTSPRSPAVRLTLALLLPAAAGAVQWVLWPHIQPFGWFLFFPTVFLSARLAGIKGGVGAALISSAIVYFLFMPPETAGRVASDEWWTPVLFVLTGFLFGQVHERLDAERRRTTDALSQSEQRFKAVVDQSLAGIYILQDERFRYVNPEFARIFGYDDPSELIDRVRVDALVAPVDRDRVAENTHRRLAGELAQLRYSFKGLRKDGEVIDVQIHGRAFDYDGRPAIIGVAVDNTDRIHALEQLHESDRLLLRTSALAKVGGWKFDVPSMEGKWTEETARIHGVDPADAASVATGVTFFEGWSREAIDTAIQNAIDKQLPYDLELELIAATGERKWIRTVGQPIVVNGRTVRVEGSIQDVTDRMEAQLALRRSEERYRSLVEQTVDGIFVSDPEGRYLDANPAGCEMFGYTYDEITSMSIADVLHPNERTRLPAELARFEWDDSARSEWRAIRKDGSEFCGEVVGRLLPDGRLQSIVRDITERKAAEEEIRELNASLELRVEQRTTEVTAANRELEAFAYAVSHDLRAPLRAMSGFCQALKEDYGDTIDETAERYIEHISSASRNMGELIDGLLLLSRATRGDMTRERIDVSSLAERIVEQRRAIHPEHDVAVEIEPGLEVFGDTRMIEVLMQNLINNAWKYTGKTEHPIVRIGSAESEGLRWIFVSDNGAGFDPRYAGQLFEPFHRLHRQDDFPGIGIGLATVQRIVNRHGGRITAEAAPDEGATFSFWIPDGEPPAPAA